MASIFFKKSSIHLCHSAGMAATIAASMIFHEAHASSWRCIDSDGHTYTSSQRVPSDTCQDMSTGASYAAAPDDSKDQPLVAPVKSSKPTATKRIMKEKTRRPGASIGMSREEAIGSSWGGGQKVSTAQLPSMERGSNGSMAVGIICILKMGY